MMSKEDWVRKLTSRKFWISLAAFVSMMTVALGGTEDRATQITSLIMAGGAVIAYTLGEGFIDGMREGEKDNGDR
ncbi:MAG: hypothetical protein IKN30_07465 [Synergistaceae bacterium]|nr:hypothetical protein [Synergistaceae bacterium]